MQDDMNYLPIKKFTCNETRVINLCAVFYTYMLKRKKGVIAFSSAILWLSDINDNEKVIDADLAEYYLNRAIMIAF